MLARTVSGIIVMMFMLVQAGNAAGKDDIQKYFNDTASKVKATADPVQKREILNNSLKTMSKALDIVKVSPLIPKEDINGIDNFKTALQENQDELSGANGYERVTDAQLNSFSDYVLQNMEQAVTRPVTISLLAAILIGVIVILLIV